METGTFTRFVRGLADGREPTTSDVEGVLEALRGALGVALRRRGLWHCSPSLLGVDGHASWTTPAAGPTLLGDALGELASDCYVYIFVHRLARLRAQLSLKPNIDGLVYLNVKHFLFDIQRRNDPIGYRIFQVLRTTIRQLEADGTIRVIHGPSAMRNESVLAFASSADSGERVAIATAVPGEFAERCAEALLPEVITARGRAVRGVADRLAELLPALFDHGVGGFRLGDLNGLLREAVRARWAARAAGAAEAGWHDERDRVTLTGLSSETSKGPAALPLLDEVDQQIEGLGTDPKTRRYLRTLLHYLGDLALDRILGVDGEPLESVPSYRRLSSALGIPRERLPGLFGLLRELALPAKTPARPTEAVVGCPR